MLGLCFHLKPKSKQTCLAPPIVWLARTVKVERPFAPRLLDCARFANGGRLGRHAWSVHVWIKIVVIRVAVACQALQLGRSSVKPSVKELKIVIGC